jgi:hypothetical protein
MEEPSKEVASADGGGEFDRVASGCGSVEGVGRSQGKRAMGAMLVVVTRVDAQDVGELPPAEDQDPVEALAPDAFDPTLRVRLRPRRRDWRADHPDPFRAEDLVEDERELAVAVTD